MSGLQPSLKWKVHTLQPQNRVQLIRMAKDVEEDLLGDEGIQRKSVKRWFIGKQWWWRQPVKFSA